MCYIQRMVALLVVQNKRQSILFSVNIKRYIEDGTKSNMDGWRKGNKLEDAKLDKVSVTRHEDGKTLVKDMWTRIDKDETLSNIVVLQQDLQQLNTVLPDQFTFRWVNRLVRDYKRHGFGSPRARAVPEFFFYPHKRRKWRRRKKGWFDRSKQVKPQQQSFCLPLCLFTRIHIQQDDHQCVYQSPSFQVTE